MEILKKSTIFHLLCYCDEGEYAFNRIDSIIHYSTYFVL